MLEEQKIIDKLKAEGINESISKGLNFETEEALNGWVDNFKTTITKPKSLGDYTKDELKSLADKGEVKNLQSLLDEVRTKAKAKGKPTNEGSTPEDKGEGDNDAISQITKAINDLKEKMESSLNEQKTKSLEEKKNAYIDEHTKGFSALDVSVIKQIMGNDATKEQLDAKIAEFRKERLAQGLDGYASNDNHGGQSNGELDATWKEALKSMKEKKNKKNK